MTTLGTYALGTETYAGYAPATVGTLPLRAVEIEFDPGVWTDVFADVAAVSSRRGRNRESGAFETGHMAFTLRNGSRKYDPDNAAGPFYGKLRPNRRVRWRNSYAGTTYPTFVGYIDRIAQVGGGPNDADAVIDVSDLFKIMNRVELPSSAYVTEVLADNPVSLWRLNEPVGSTIAKDSVGSLDLDVYGAPAFGAPSLITREAGSATAIPDHSVAAISKNTTLPITGAPCTLEVVVKKDVGADDGLWVSAVTTPLTQGGLWIQAATTIVAMQAINGVNAQTLATTTGVNLDDGATHHIVGRWDASGALRIFVDGVDRTNGTPSVAPVPFTASTGVVSAYGTPPGVTGLPCEGVAQMAAIYNYALADARIAAHNTAMRTPWNNDLPGTRLGRIFDQAGVAAGDRDLDAGDTTLQSTSLGTTALAYAQKVEETEAGMLFVARDGKLRFVGRSASVTGQYLTPKFTLVDDDSGPGIPYRVGDAEVNEATIVTRATASRDGSVAITVTDAAARAEFGLIDEVHEGLLSDSDTYSKSYAEWILNTHKAPSSRVGTVTLELTRDPVNMIPAVLALELGDRVTFKRKPQNVGAVTTLDMRVEAITHSTGGGYWRTDLQLTPFGLGAGGAPVWVWDVTTWDNQTWGL